MLALASTVVLSACGGADDATPSDPVAALQPGQIKSIHAAQHGGAPGLAGGVISDGKIVVAADGKAVSTGTAPLTPEHWLHLGSNGKSMTAMAVPVQAERGTLRWSDSLEKLFPELAATMRPGYRQRTVLELLAFRAGFAPMLQRSAFEPVPVTASTLPEQRLAFACWLLSQPPVNAPGTTTEYANASDILAGLITERASGIPFQQTIQDTVLCPLGLHGQYGLPQTVGPDQPAAHAQPEPGVYQAVAPDDPLALQVPAHLDSAGLLCMPVTDYARHAQIHLQALRGKPTLRTAQTYQVLHTALGQISGSDFGLSPGWGVLTQGGKTTHEFTGSTDLMSAHIKIDPAANRAVIVMNNYAAGASLDTPFTQSAAQLLALKPAR
ncbi:MAG: serine hydrolase [Aquabacterium sp.]|nr:serine hydrolase [Aquabacterium sp.]